jgi:hypothetical protein
VAYPTCSTVSDGSPSPRMRSKKETMAFNSALRDKLSSCSCLQLPRASVSLSRSNPRCGISLSEASTQVKKEQYQEKNNTSSP